MFLQQLCLIESADCLINIEYSFTKTFITVFQEQILYQREKTINTE